MFLTFIYCKWGNENDAALYFLRSLPTIWSINLRHSRIHYLRKEKLLSYVRDKQTVMQEASLPISTLTRGKKKKRELRGFKSWGSWWQISWEGMQWNKLAQCWARSRCTINTCTDRWVNEWTKMPQVMALSHDLLVQRASPAKNFIEMFEKK